MFFQHKKYWSVYTSIDKLLLKMVVLSYKNSLPSEALRLVRERSM